MKEIYEYAKAFYEQPLNFDSNNYVLVEHDDGSRLLFTHAFTEQYNKDWTIVYTEHHGFAIYHKEDARVIEMKIKE